MGGRGGDGDFRIVIGDSGSRAVVVKDKTALALVKETSRELTVRDEARARDEAIVKKWGGARATAVLCGMTGAGLVFGALGAALIAPPLILLFPLSVVGGITIGTAKTISASNAGLRINAMEAEERRLIEADHQRIEAERCARLAKEALAVFDSNVETGEIREGANIFFDDPEKAGPKLLLRVVEIVDYTDAGDVANSGQQITATLHDVTVHNDGSFTRGAEIAGVEPIRRKIPHSSGPLSNVPSQLRRALPFPTP
jgi:hypothetical protein